MMTRLTRHHRQSPFSKKLPAILLAAGFGLAAAPALAAECQITYSDYEDGIPHVDLATCPGNMPDEDTEFCRLAFDGMQATFSSSITQMTTLASPASSNILPPGS